MADFDLQQTDQQVQSILNDGQSAMGAGAQTTLTTEYVMLKDVNGVYHKILKDSLTEACRNVLAGLLVNNDKGTTINQIPAIAGGDLGSVTPANLASVLGVKKSVPFGMTNGNNVTMQVSYGILYIQDMSTGGCSIIPVSNGIPLTPVFSLYNENNICYKVESVNSTNIKITRTAQTTYYDPLQAIALVVK